MSCESGKCNIKKSLLVPDEAEALENEERQLVEPRSPEQIEYALQAMPQIISKVYPPPYWLEVRNKTHG